MRLRTALVGAALATLLAAPAVDAAVRERVKVSIPDPGQLAAARLEFKVEGDRTPELKLKLKNARKLSDSVIAAGQMMRSTEEKGRAVVLLAIGNVQGSGAPRKALRVTGENALVEVKQAGTDTKISDIEFESAPRSSRSFASVLGLEPGKERQQAQKTFDITERQVRDDAFGRFDVSDVFKVMELKPVRESQIITRGDLPGDIEKLFRELGISSGIAAGIGPPAVLDAELYELVTGQPRPFLLNGVADPSPNPSVYFVRVDFSVPVMGAQVSQAGEIDLLDSADARCQDGFFNEGTVIRGFGPRVTAGLGFRLDCDLVQDHPRVFFDVPLEQTPVPGTDLFLLTPFPYYGVEGIGEAVGGPGTTFMVRSP